MNTVCASDASGWSGRVLPLGLLLLLLITSGLGCGSDGSDSSQAPPGGGAPAPPIPQPSPGQNVVQFVNESNVTLLLAAFGPTAVLPREGTWVLKKGQYLTIDIPTAWQNTTAVGSAGPRFWARTGCKYDQSRNIAQCETGNWGGYYDAFNGSLRPFPAGVSPNTFTEWCFNCGDNHVFWDVSAVDGGDLSVNVQPLGSYSQTNPLNPSDVFWCKYPNAVSGEDPRDPTHCPPAFRLKRSQLKSFLLGSEDHTVACFSNCGRLKYPNEPSMDCTDATDSRCSAWRRYCCTASAAEYSKMCNSDADCSYGNGCLALVDTAGHPVKLCQCRAWVRNPPCPDSICTNQREGVPPYGACSGDASAGPFQCIGEDGIHEVLPRAFSWPNDPQTYGCDARAFRVTFAPGGTSVPITNVSDIPLCEKLSKQQYDPTAAKQTCSGVTDKVFGGARPVPQLWACKADGTVDAVLCRW